MIESETLFSILTVLIFQARLRQAKLDYPVRSLYTLLLFNEGAAVHEDLIQIHLHPLDPHNIGVEWMIT